MELVRLVRERGGEGRLVDEGSNAIATFRPACQEIFNPAYFEPLHSRGRVGFWKSSGQEFATSPCEVTSL